MARETTVLMSDLESGGWDHLDNLLRQLGALSDKVNAEWLQEIMIRLLVCVMCACVCVCVCACVCVT